MSTEKPLPPASSVEGVFRYLDATAEPSLRRNGKVLTRRDGDGSDDEWIGVNLVPRGVAVQDARALETDAPRTLARHGFERIDGALPDPDLDFLDHERVVRRYYPHCEALIREATGARRVAAFDHNVRSAAGKRGRHRIRGGQQVQGPAHVVHGDYTLTSAAQRLRDLCRPPGGNDTLRFALAAGEALLDADEVEAAVAGGRFGIVNVWRNIAAEPVAVNPLAMCDAATVDVEDLVVFEIHYADRVGENYFAKFAERHDWYYYPALARDEALLLKQWDSAGALAASDGASADSALPEAPCTFSFHSAFEDPSTPADAPDRWSIEVRCAVLHD